MVFAKLPVGSSSSSDDTLFNKVLQSKNLHWFFCSLLWLHCLKTILLHYRAEIGGSLQAHTLPKANTLHQCNNNNSHNNHHSI